jgi:hypothetical protein
MPEASRRIIQLSPQAESLPEGLLLPPEQGGEVVAFLVDPDVADWAAEALVRLARGWAERGRQVLLAEGDLAGPRLHAVIGVKSAEGIADALHFGASPERIITEVPGEPFRFVPAGTVVPDPAQAWRHEGWIHLLRSLRDDRVVLLALPADREFAQELATRADRVFRMSGTLPGPDAPHPVIHPPGAIAGSDTSAVLDPPEGASSPEGRGTGAGEGRAVEGMIRPDQDTLAERKPPTAARKGKRAKPVATDGAPTSAVRRRPGRLVLLLVVIVVLAILLIGAAWLGFLEIPGVSLSPRTATGEFAWLLLPAFAD